MENERVIYASCPLCNSTSIAHLLAADCSRSPRYQPQLESTIRWSKCDGCGHVFTEGYYTEQAQKVLFSTTDENQRPGAALEKNRAIAARMIEKVLPYRDRGVWIDVGFGNGALLMTADEYGFDPVGLDLREQNVIAMRLLGFECLRQDIGEFAYDRPAAVVSMADVLEHTPWPKQSLAAAYELLEPGGVIFLSMPNADSFLWKTASRQNANPYWEEMEHYHNFGRRRLYDLLQEMGFTPVRYGVSERHRMCMEIIATKGQPLVNS